MNNNLDEEKINNFTVKISDIARGSHDLLHKYLPELSSIKEKQIYNRISTIKVSYLL